VPFEPSINHTISPNEIQGGGWLPQEPYDYNLNTRMKAEYNLTGMKADGMEDFKDWSRQDSHAKVSKLF